MPARPAGLPTFEPGTVEFPKEGVERRPNSNRLWVLGAEVAGVAGLTALCEGAGVALRVMDSLRLAQAPVVHAGLLIRPPELGVLWLERPERLVAGGAAGA